MLHTCAGHSARIAGEPPTAGFAITPYQFQKKIDCVAGIGSDQLIVDLQE